MCILQLSVFHWNDVLSDVDAMATICRTTSVLLFVSLIWTALQVRSDNRDVFKLHTSSKVNFIPLPALIIPSLIFMNFYKCFSLSPSSMAWCNTVVTHFFYKFHFFTFFVSLYINTSTVKILKDFKRNKVGKCHLSKGCISNKDNLLSAIRL